MAYAARRWASAWRLNGLALLIAAAFADSNPAIAQSVTTATQDNGIAGALASELRELRAYPHLDRAYRLVARNELQDARVEFERHLALDPDHVPARTAYVMLLYRLREYADAIQQADIVVRRDPAAVDAWLYRGMAKQATHRTDAAVADFKVVAADRRASAAARRYALDSMADIALASRRFDDARTALDALAALAPDHRVYLRQGRALEALGLKDAAAAAYRQALTAARTVNEQVNAYRAIAAAARRTGRWSAARAALLAGAKLDPANAEIVEDLVATASGARDFSDAAHWMHVAVAQRPSNDRRLALAELLSSAGDYTAAAEEFTAVASQSGSRQTQYRAWMGAGHAHDMLGEYGAAATKYRAAASLRHDGRTLATLAQALELAGEVPKAIRAWTDAGRANRSAEYTLRAGLLEAKADRRAAAIRDLTSALRGSLPAVSRALALRQLGFVQRAAGNLPAAAKAFERATALDRRDTTALIALAEVRLASGDAAAAVTEASRAAAIAENPAAWRVLAAADAKAGRQAEAANIYRRLANAAKTSADASRSWTAAGHVEFDRKNYGAAAAAFRSAYRSSNSKDPQVLVHAADAEIAGEKWVDAETDLLTITKRADVPKSTRADTYERLGVVYSKLEKPSDAVASLQSAIELGRDGPELRQNLGYALFKAERWRDAVDAFRWALARTPSPRIRAALAQCYERLGKPGLALHLVREALDNAGGLDDASRRELFTTAGYLYAREGDPARAVEAFTEAVTLASDPDTLVALAAAYRALDRVDEAVRALDRVDVTRLTRRRRLAYLDERSAALAAVGEYARAADVLAAANREDPTAARSYQLGLFASKQGQLSREIDHFEAAVAREPRNTRYLEALGYAYRRASRPRDAVRTFEAALQLDPDYLSLYEELAYLHRQIGPAAVAGSWMTRAIDNSVLFSADTVDRQRELQRHIYQLRRENLELATRFEVNAYTMLRSPVGSASGVTTGTAGGAIPSSSGVEVAYRPFSPVASHPRIQVYSRAAADMASRLFSEENHDQLSIGLRYQPFPTINLAVSGERAIAGQPLGPWLFRGLYSWDSGFSLRPSVRTWRYAFILGDTAFVPGGRERAAAYLETRQGLTVNLRDAWLITPHLVGDVRIAEGPAFASTTNAYVEAGLGTSFKYLFNADAYRSHRSAVEMIVQYRQRHEDAGAATKTAGGWVVMSVVSLR